MTSIADEQVSVNDTPEAEQGRWTRLEPSPGAPSDFAVWLWQEEDSPQGWAGPPASLRFVERSRFRLRIECPAGAEIAPQVGEAVGSSELLELKKGEFLWSGDWGDYVGLSRLQIRVDGKLALDLPVEVYSRKLEYESDYRRLLDELADWLAVLVFSAAKPTSVPIEHSTLEQSSLYLVYLLFRHLMQPHRLPAAFERVRMEPHRRLVRESRQVDFSQARQLDAHTLLGIATSADLARGTGVLGPAASRLLRGYAPARLVDSRPRTDFDTLENRFVSHFLQALNQRCGELELAFHRDAEEHPGRGGLAQSLADDCHRWAGEVGEMQRAHFLEDVGQMNVFPSSSQVLQRREGYRGLRDAYLQLLLSPRVRWDGMQNLLNVPSRDVPTLYEYWCFFALADGLSSVTGISPDWHAFVHGKRNVWEIWLQQGLESRVRIGPATLWFNRSFHKDSYSLPLRPDFSVELGGRLLLFDAKYRLTWQELREAFQDEEPDEAHREATFKRVDLYKMHAYRDAIRGAEAVFILYPGDVFRAFTVDGTPFIEPQDAPGSFAGVGAIPVRPGRTTEMEHILRVLVAGGQD